MRHVYPTIVAVLFAVTISTLPHTSTHAAPSVIVVSGNISVSTTWTSGNIYYVTSDTTVVAGVTLRIEPGVIVKFRSNSGLIIDGKLEAMGTASQPIYFTSYRDDSVGGDTDGGGSSSGEKGDWNWIQFNAISDDASLIEHAVIRYGGGKSWRRGVYGNVYLRDASPTIRHSTLEYSEGAGIHAQNATPTLICNDIMNNAALGIHNASPDTIISAINQYWGDPSGPKHATLNPNGRGNGVSDGVTFVPWQTTSCGTPSSSLSGVFLPLVIR